MLVRFPEINRRYLLDIESAAGAKRGQRRIWGIFYDIHRCATAKSLCQSFYLPRWTYRVFKEGILIDCPNVSQLQYTAWDKHTKSNVAIRSYIWVVFARSSPTNVGLGETVTLATRREMNVLRINSQPSTV